ncbi:MAG: 1,4-dihydroxy-6-naphthoate synthase [Waddliaceae bacterium]|nr:1,4-dihydroxy-6-naphthoate synthase [Waddliaceae bacterium]
MTSHRNLQMGFSPCPNDIFILHAWMTEKIESPIKISPILADIQQLNEWAKSSAQPLLKVSFSCLGRILDDYVLLPSGAAIGSGCGPKLIAKKEFEASDLNQMRVAIPGEHTSAYLLMQLLLPTCKEAVFCTYDQVLSLLEEDKVDCGLIIHETRFTFEDMGYIEICDLGDLWENEFGLPIPLGGIAAKRDLGKETLEQIHHAIQDSVQYAWNHPEACEEYMLKTSIEKNAQVCKQHINLYVTKDSYTLSEEAIEGVDAMFELAREKGLLAPSKQAWLFDCRQAAMV